MARRRKRSKMSKEPAELNITTFLNLMVVLIPFLLISAVFSRVAIMELDVPTGGGGASSDEPAFKLEVVIRNEGFELADGNRVVATIPKEDDEYDFGQLTEFLLDLKDSYPEKDDATILVEPDIEYDYLIRTMDTLRGTEILVDGGEESRTRVLFPAISIGDAP